MVGARAASAAPGRAGPADPLELLAELNRGFAASLEVDQTVRRALSRIVEHVGSEAGSLFLLEPDGRELVCHACFGDPDITGFRVPAGQGIVGHSVREGRAQIVRDVASDPHFHSDIDRATGFTTRSILCAPLGVKGDWIGAIELVNKQGGDGLFSDADLRLLETLAASAALAIAYARAAAELADQERLRRELELAAEIQQSLLPAPRPAPFPAAGANVPARLVSGDFYDFFPLADGRVAFCIGDVSGKGMNAALLMAKTASLYRCLGRESDEPGRVLARVGDEICETATRGMFVTMAAGLYDPRSGWVRLANAGHEPPLLREPDGRVRRIPADVPPLGIAPELVARDGALPEVDVELAPGAALYLFTDGLTEGGGPDGRPLGPEGVEAAVARAASLPLAERVEAIVSGVVAARDDVTLLVLERPAA